MMQKGQEVIPHVAILVDLPCFLFWIEKKSKQMVATLAKITKISHWDKRPSRPLSLAIFWFKKGDWESQKLWPRPNRATKMNRKTREINNTRSQKEGAWGVLRPRGMTTQAPGQDFLLISCVLRSILVALFGFEEEGAFQDTFGQGYNLI